MKYNELNSEATFDKYIRENEPELIPLLTRCKDQEKNSIKNRIRDQINGRLKKNKSKKNIMTMTMMIKLLVNKIMKKNKDIIY